ncbi:N-acetylmuramoyl-L-alanine amidase family protein [Virgibacillus sp. SK37]|uniref:peptidoglycan recognition protein family protein n=1 Tax=Virgibacillus sp. SK37 TaxID=403957 RepID=UPI0004D1352F|nr:GW dipeptide domain-containing protein [Virgibacillus sp. SK37]AIF45596.1 hypothetical protein X953_16955 [Virgibacillus sp. SK37]
MKQVVISVNLLLLCFLFMSPNYSYAELSGNEDVIFVEKEEGSNTQEIDSENKAEDKLDKSTTEEVNEGSNRKAADIIKSGENSREISHIKIYGEDISNLSEEELKYIPKAWRDGNFRSEHPQESEFKAQSRSYYPDVNEYIFTQKLTSPKMEIDHISHFTKFNYRYGYGKVEGIVAHETANNNSTIMQEINYMSNNHNNAFVHAFVDQSRIIEIHPTNYGAWGAGRYANQRFVHVELVREHNFKDFASAINNYANYIATILFKYNLGVNSAEYDGKGTLWSHKAVSKFLGGTNHVDPHGYFSRWGYTWNDFVQLVNLKYNSLNIKTKSVSKVGHIRSSNAMLYESPTNPHVTQKAGEKYTHAVYYIKEQAVYNGDVYYKLSTKPSSRSGVIGWMKAKNVNVHSHSGIDKQKKNFIIKGEGSAYNKVWGGNKNKVYSLSSFKGKEFEVNLTESVGRNVWYRGILNGKQVWVHASYISTSLPQDVNMQSVSLLAHLHSKGLIIDNINDLTHVKSVSKDDLQQVYYIKKQAKVNGELFYLISKKPSSTHGVVGWLKASDLSVHTHVGVDHKSKTFYLKGTGSAYTKAWGGAKDLVYSNLGSYQGEEFKVNLTEKVGNNVWYRGVLNGQTVWLHSSYVTEQAIETSFTSKLGHIRSNSVIYPDIENRSNYKDAAPYTNAVYYIKKQAKVNGELFYLISKKPSNTHGVVGWLKASDLSVHTHVGVDHKSKTFYLKGTGSAYTKAWGGAKDLVYSNLGSYQGEEFKVNLTEKVGNNVWYRGVLNGQTVWLHSSYVTEQAIETSSTSKLGHIRSNSVIYPDIENRSNYKDAAPYTNAVYYIKKQAKVNGELFYLISKKPSSTHGVVGWLKASDLSVHAHTSVDSKAKTFYLKGTGTAYTKAWGGAKDLVYSNLRSYQGEEFKVNLTEKVGNNVWYRGVLNGQTVWLHSFYVK